MSCLIQVFIFRNADGVRGARLAKAMEGVYGLDVLEDKPTGVKCGAISSGNACADTYYKVGAPLFRVQNAVSISRKHTLFSVFNIRTVV
jgi:hypothetical protein